VGGNVLGLRRADGPLTAGPEVFLKGHDLPRRLEIDTIRSSCGSSTGLFDGELAGLVLRAACCKVISVLLVSFLGYARSRDHQ
jgi:hypothetical protein